MLVHVEDLYYCNIGNRKEIIPTSNLRTSDQRVSSNVGRRNLGGRSRINGKFINETERRYEEIPRRQKSGYLQMKEGGQKHSFPKHDQ